MTEPCIRCFRRCTNKTKSPPTGDKFRRDFRTVITGFIRCVSEDGKDAVPGAKNGFLVDDSFLGHMEFGVLRLTSVLYGSEFVKLLLNFLAGF